MSTTVTPLQPVILAPQERQVLEGLADGTGIDQVAFTLSITSGTASGYVKSARAKLGPWAPDVPSALAVSYAIEAITAPVLRRRDEIYVSGERQALIPLIAQGLPSPQIALALGRPIQEVRADCRGLRIDVDARNNAHLISRAFEFQLLTAADVAGWMLPAERELKPLELRARIATVRGWESRTSAPPSADDATAITRELAAGGKLLVAELNRRVKAMAPTSTLAQDVRATIADANRRLDLPEIFSTRDSAVDWAVRTARLVSTLLYACHKARRQQGLL
ncbi:DUF6415 family natural product biosynthesis protein [Streptomyces sp. NPDC101490]|uniref:DUF6415 family natural product biosynthesis protein n=1 Tax=Streptomyces sp. NPDC101490 TaxID=3366143 RepID=UPI00381C7D6E